MPKTLAQPAAPKLIPLGNRLLISPPPETSEGGKKDLQQLGGIFIPEVGETGKMPIEAYYLAEVLAAGSECTTVKKGDKVVVPRQLVWGVTIDGKKLGVFVRENECHMAMR